MENKKRSSGKMTLIQKGSEAVMKNGFNLQTPEKEKQKLH
jgi:hypothetical protein